MKKLLLSLVLLLALMPASAEEFTYDFLGQVADGWTSNPQPFGQDMGSTARGTQYNASGAKSATLTLHGAKGVESVVVTCSANVAGQNTISVLVGNVSLGTDTLDKANNVEKTFTAEGKPSGDLVLDLGIASKSLYISRVVVVADAIDANEGATETLGLDPDYTYGEPTTLLPTGDTGNNAAYTFTQNNVKVSVSTGAEDAKYFGVNAGQTITFTATKPIKGLLINGYAKQGFSATASNGTLAIHGDCAGYAVEGYPVLVATDIDQTTVTITCTKQLRIFKAELYFDANPTAQPDYSPEAYTYDLEPATPTTIDREYQAMEIYDLTESYGYNYTLLYLYNTNDDLSIGIYAPADQQTGVAPGTYQVDYSMAEGTVDYSYGRQNYYDASKNSFETYDWPTYIGEYDQSFNLAKAYYIVGGTLTVEAWGTDGLKITLDGESYNYSTIHATYSQIPTAIVGAAATDNTERVRKVVRHGQLLIERGNERFNAAGQRLR